MPSSSSSSSSSTTNNNKVNPFYISQDDPYGENEDEYDGWGDDEHNDWIVQENPRYPGWTDEEQQPFRNNSNNNQWQRSSNARRRNVEPKFFASQSTQNHHHHQPQLWKYILLLAVVIFAVVVLNGKNDDDDDANYESLIDEIPNDEYRIVIVGERHSGGSWLHARLEECFPRAMVSTSLQRPGIFFQDDETQWHHDTIVVHVTLNIYDWLEQMRASPEYAPNHVGKHRQEGHMVPLQWNEFLAKPWTMDSRPARDLPFANSTDPICQLGFRYHQVVSCIKDPLAGTHNPIYELDASAEKGNNNNQTDKPFPSIIDMRAAKLRNHHNLQEWKSVKKLISVPYESVGEEFKRLLYSIQELSHMTPSCSGEVLQPSRDRFTDMSMQFVQYVTQHADWEAEGLVSYEPWTDTEIQAKGIHKKEEKENNDVDGTINGTDKRSDKPTNPPTIDEKDLASDNTNKDESTKPAGDDIKSNTTAVPSDANAKGNAKDVAPAPSAPSETATPANPPTTAPRGDSNPETMSPTANATHPDDNSTAKTEGSGKDATATAATVAPTKPEESKNDTVLETANKNETQTPDGR